MKTGDRTIQGSSLRTQLFSFLVGIINMTHHSNKMKDKNHIIILINAEKHSTSIYEKIVKKVNVDKCTSAY